MRYGFIVGLGAMWLAAPAMLQAQLVSESTDGNRRLCNYARPNPILTSMGPTHVISVPLGESCPANYPGDATVRTALPVTAALLGEDEFGSDRRCQYSQAGVTWTRYLPIRFHCPLSAGMLPPEARNSPSTFGEGDQGADR